MPEEAYWEGFFDAAAVLQALLPGESLAGDAVEFGCGYGTFTLAEAARSRGMVSTFDIDPAMVARTCQRAEDAGLDNVRASVRDFIAEGTGLSAASQSRALIFNLLHIEVPLALLDEALRVLEVDGRLLVIHWRSDIPTPRGPSLEIRPTAAQCTQWITQAGFRAVRVVDLSQASPYHFGLIAER